MGIGQLLANCKRGETRKCRPTRVCLAIFSPEFMSSPSFASRERWASFSRISLPSNGDHVQDPIRWITSVARRVHSEQATFDCQGSGSWTPSLAYRLTMFLAVSSFSRFCSCGFAFVSYTRTSFQPSYRSQAEYSRSLLYARFPRTVALYNRSFAIRLFSLRNIAVTALARVHIVYPRLERSKSVDFTEK